MTASDLAHAAPDLKAIQALAAPDMTAMDALIRRRLASDVVLINQVAEYIIGAGGKRLRPMLLLLTAGAQVKIASLDDPGRSPVEAEFHRVDLREFSECLKIAKGCDIVFQLAGVKGSPAMTAKRPASFFVPTVTFNTNMMEAARRRGVERYLFTSSVGVYGPAEVFHEDDVWKTFPSPNDRFAGWAKRVGELQADAYRIEYGWNGVSIKETLPSSRR